MFNRLHFSAPERIRRRLREDPECDVGVWAMFGGEIVVRIRPAIDEGDPACDIIFNSAAGHQCVCQAEFLDLACDPPRLAAAASRFAAAEIEAARKDIHADPSLADGFYNEELAARCQSSIVGTTTFLSEQVVATLLRAAHSEMPENVLWEEHKRAAALVAAKAKGGAARGKPKLSSEEKKAQSAELMRRLEQLELGAKVTVHTKSGPKEGRVAAEVAVALTPYDMNVFIKYDGEKVKNEWLGYLGWKLGWESE